MGDSQRRLFNEGYVQLTILDDCQFIGYSGSGIKNAGDLLAGVHWPNNLPPPVLYSQFFNGSGPTTLLTL
jgi:hypothetical protein